MARKTRTKIVANAANDWWRQQNPGKPAQVEVYRSSQHAGPRRHAADEGLDPSWSLRRANIGRDRKTGRFTRRTVRRRSAS